MPVSAIFPSVYALSGIANVYFIDEGDALTLIDTGYPNSAAKILAAAQSLGKPISQILLTHNHPDHIGSLAALQQATNAPAWIHPADRAFVEAGGSAGSPKPAPFFISRVLCALVARGTPAQIAAAHIAHTFNDGDVLPFGGGLRVIHTPGHSAGHVALLLERDGGLLFAADACANLFGLGYSIVYDDFATGQRSLQKLSQLSFDQVCYGHGKPTSGAAFRAKWSSL